ncbi:hypothetical protein PSACC_03702 [Paramicrosporidium saccamoebae]|uniref:CTLH domain-containing protein n=1 Tax=Paramicrosporidium saccamoebae TaxID=1246581 RepID=A0A2H9TFL7_9FUNG|nr:hypothetical protein PSACC_03702 [Paramicrosporidium saccamoebae]
MPQSTTTTHKTALINRIRRRRVHLGVGLGMPQTDVSAAPYEETHLIRVILQSLREHGFSRAAASLEEESGVKLELSSVTLFREAVLGGNYDTALELVPEMVPKLSEKSLRLISFLIERERYLELLESRKVQDALKCLRNSVTPNTDNLAEIQTLAALITVSGDLIELQSRANWIGTGRAARQQLLSCLQPCLPNSLMLPEKRMEQLLGQAYKTQVAQCPIHYLRNPNTCSHLIDGILSDHQCDGGSSSFHMLKKLAGHHDEVWFASVSTSGEFLATASRDHSVIIWDLPHGNIVYTLKDHAAGVIHVAWSPDDKYLLTCSLDSRARLWDMQTGDCIRIFMLNNEAAAGVWSSDGSAIIVASQDGSLTRFSKDGMAAMRRSLRCIDLINLNGERIAALDNHGTVHIIGTSDLTTLTSFNVNKHSSACALSKAPDGEAIIVCELDPGVVSVWEPNVLDIYEHSTSYVDHINKKYVIRPCLAREDRGIMSSGSEDGVVYLYHRESLHVVQQLKGHDSVVNCTAWTDSHGGILVSVSDDHTVCLWSRHCQPPSTSE